MLYKMRQLGKSNKELTTLFVDVNHMFPSKSELLRVKGIIEELIQSFPKTWEYLRYVYVSTTMLFSRLSALTLNEQLEDEQEQFFLSSWFRKQGRLWKTVSDDRLLYVLKRSIHDQEATVSMLWLEWASVLISF